MTIQEDLMRGRDWIESALKKGGETHDFKDVVDGVMKGDFQLWMGSNGCAVTEILVYPNKKILHVFLEGGAKGHGIDQITDMHDSAVEFAKRENCQGMTVSGRAGWKKILVERGWKQQFITLSKEI